MSILKQINDKGATIAWSPLRTHPGLLATGTKEGGGGGFDDYGGELAVHSFDFSSPSLDGTVISSVKTPQRFTSLAWGALSNKPALRHGLIVGGMADGVVNVWDATSLVNGAQDGGAVAMIERHAAAVRAVQFNPHPAAQHLIGAASIDGDISIINLESPGSPTVASPLGGGQRLDAEITSLAWNTSVTHILATATVAGVVVVWDLKENKPWCQLRDPHRAAISDVAWAPNDGLYLVTACDDDSRPVLRLWDLRSSTTTPLCEFAGHTKGVLSVDWCPHDPNLLVSCGKDARTFVWDIQQGRAIAEAPAPVAPASTAGGGGGTNTPRQGLGSAAPPYGGFNEALVGAGGSNATSVFGSAPSQFVGGGGGAFGGAVDAGTVFGGTTLGGIGAGAGRRYAVRWSRHLPSVFAACSLDRRVTVHGISAAGPQLTARSAYPGAAGQAVALEATLLRAPRWLRRPAAAAFGFGGRLITFGAPAAAVRADLRAGAVPYSKTVNLATVCTDHTFVSRALAFEAALGEIERGATDPRSLCDAKATEAAAAGDAATSAVWSMMRLLFEPDTRSQLLAFLGYEPSRISAEVAAYAGTANCALVGRGASVVSVSGAMGDAVEGEKDGTMGGAVASGADGAPSDGSGGPNGPPGGGAGASPDGPPPPLRTSAPATVTGGLEAAAAASGGVFGRTSLGGAAAWPSAADVFSSSVSLGADGGAAGVGGSSTGLAGTHAASSSSTTLASGGLGSAASSAFNSGHVSAADVFGGVGGAAGGGTVVPRSPGVGAIGGGVGGAASPSHLTRSNSDGAFGGDVTAGSSAQKADGAGTGATAMSRVLGNSATEDADAVYAPKRVPSAADNAMLKRALLVGDFAVAVAACLRQDRLDDALLLSGLGSAELWHATQEEVFRRRASPVMTIMTAIIKGELGALVAGCDPSEWRETLALLCTYAKPDGFSPLAEALGDRLLAAGAAADGVLVYMCAGSVGKAVEIWVRESRVRTREVGAGPALQDLVERVTLLRRAVALATGGSVTAGAQQAEADAFVEYAAALADEGYLAAAANFASRVVDVPPTADGGAPSSSALGGALLRDRLARAFARADYAWPAVQAVAQSPFPLHTFNIGPAPAPPQPAVAVQHAMLQPAQQQHAAYGNGGPYEAAAGSLAQGGGGYDTAHGGAMYAPAQQQQQQYDAYGNALPPQSQAASGPVGVGGYFAAAQAQVQPQSGFPTQQQHVAPQPPPSFGGVPRSGAVPPPAQQVPTLHQGGGYGPPVQGTGLGFAIPQQTSVTQPQQQPHQYGVPAYGAPPQQQPQQQQYAQPPSQGPPSTQPAAVGAIGGAYAGTPAPYAHPHGLAPPASMAGGGQQAAATPLQPPQHNVFNPAAAQASHQQQQYAGGPNVFNPATAAPAQQQQQQHLPPQSMYGGGSSTAGGGSRITTFTPAAAAAPPQLAPIPQAVPSYGGGGSTPYQQQPPQPQTAAFVGSGPYGVPGAAPPPSQVAGGGQPPQAPAASPPAPQPVPVSPEMDAALSNLQGTVSALGTLGLNASETKQLQEASAALTLIRSKLQSGSVTGDAQVKLQVLASQCAAYDFRGAQKTQSELASIDWNASKEWQKGVRNLVTLALVKSSASSR